MVFRLDGPVGPLYGPPAPAPTSGSEGPLTPEDVQRILAEGIVAPGEGALPATFAERLPQVWLGYNPPFGDHRPQDRETPGYTPPKESRVADLPDAEMMVYEWYGTDAYDKWGDFLAEHGIIEKDESRDFDTLNKWWVTAANQSSLFYSIGRNFTPWDVIEGFGKDSGGRRGSGGGGGGGPRTVTSTSVDLTDPDTARAIVNSALSDRLGRAANDEEVSTFLNVLNSAERANPTVTTSHYSGDGSSVSSTTTGGIGATGKQQLAVDEALENPEYGAYQAASTYYNALIQALGSPL